MKRGTIPSAVMPRTAAIHQPTRRFSRRACVGSMSRTSPVLLAADRCYNRFLQPLTRLSFSKEPAAECYAKSYKSAPGGNRTPDLDVRTVLLYPLSYGGVARSLEVY